jgi:hypothetical protein
LPLSLLTGFVHSLLLGNGIGGRLVRRIPPLLVPRAPELRPDGRADVAPREHLTRHLCGLISRSGAGGVQEDPGTPSARADRYLIAEAAAQCRDQRLSEGMQVARQDAERNADAPPVVHRRTIATLRAGTCTITAADPMPDLPDALDRIHRYSGTQ